jgi:ABC-type branched-subunit amino acid transport system ATPase component
MTNRTQTVSILIVKQKVRKVLTIADHVYSLKLGKVAFSGPPVDLTANPETLRRLFL